MCETEIFDCFVDSEEQSDTAMFQAAMDINHFRQLIREAEQEHSVARDPAHVKEFAKSIASNMKHHGMHTVTHRLTALFPGLPR